MDQPTSQPAPHRPLPKWKRKLLGELARYFINVIYLSVFFGAFAWYRRFILAEYRISYLNYGSALIEALILAKVVWIGEVLHIVRQRDDKPLIHPTLKNALVFTVFVAFFEILERMAGGAIKGIGAIGGVVDLWHNGKFELLARCVMTFCAFIPFFAFRELARQLGEGKLWKLFFGHNQPEILGTPA